MTPLAVPAAPPPRLRAWDTGVAAAIFAAAIVGASDGGQAWVAALWFLAQAALPLTWAFALDVPAPLGAALIATGAGWTADVLVLDHSHVGLEGLAGVVAVSFLMALLHQLVRRNRSRVTEALAATLGLVVLSLTGAVDVALRGLPTGRQALTAAALGIVTALLVARLVDALAPWPAITGRARRGLAGLVVGVAVAAGAGAGYGAANPQLSTPLALGLATLAAVLAACGDVGVELGLAAARRALGGRSGHVGRLVLSGVLPVMVSVAPAYVLARLALT